MHFLDLLSPSQWLIATVSVICKQITGFEAVHFVLSGCVLNKLLHACTPASMWISMRNLCNGVILAWLCIIHSKVHSHTAVLWQLISSCDYYHLSNRKSYLCWNSQPTFAVADVGQVHVKYPHFHFCILFELYPFLAKLSRFVYKQTKPV